MVNLGLKIATVTCMIFAFTAVIGIGSAIQSFRIQTEHDHKTSRLLVRVCAGVLLLCTIVVIVDVLTLL